MNIEIVRHDAIFDAIEEYISKYTKINVQILRKKRMNDSRRNRYLKREIQKHVLEYIKNTHCKIYPYCTRCIQELYACNFYSKINTTTEQLGPYIIRNITDKQRMKYQSVVITFLYKDLTNVVLDYIAKY